MVINGENLGNNLTVTGGTLIIDGKNFESRSLLCNMTNGFATITAVFPYSGELKNASLTLNINGSDMNFDLGNNVGNTKLTIVGNAQDSSNLHKSSKAISSIQPVKDMVIYVDGKKVEYSELNNIPSDKISSVSMDKNTMIITLKR